jgi:hypothetical protein
MGVALLWGVAPLVAMEVAGTVMCRVIRKGSPRPSLRWTLLFALLSLPLAPLAAFVNYWALTGDLGASLAHLRFAFYFTPLAAVLLAYLARKRAEELRYEDEWASLVIAGTAEGDGCRFLDGRETNG